MNSEHLVDMANRIGEFFEAMPDRDEALGGVATHLKSFWDPRMRRELLAHLDAGGEGMSAIVVAAVRLNRAGLTPKPLTNVPVASPGPEPDLPVAPLVAGDC